MRDLLPFVGDDAVLRALASIGRTEDVRFSSDDRRLAIAGFEAGKLLILDIELDFSAGRKQIALLGAVELAAPDLVKPHGVDFLDPNAVVVANRDGSLAMFRIPEWGRGHRAIAANAVPLAPGREFAGLSSPGSVAAIPLGDRRYDILVCNNYVHCVSRHRVVMGERRAWVRRNQTLLREAMNIPDGVAVSRSGRWIAISSHGTSSVLVFRNDAGIDITSRPLGFLHEVGYPHGVRFSLDERSILVADAGRPYVSVFRSEDGDWTGTFRPWIKIRVMSDEVFAIRHENPAEGGPKGIDVDSGMNVLAVTTEEQRLTFLDLPAATARLAAKRASQLAGGNGAVIAANADPEHVATSEAGRGISLADRQPPTKDAAPEAGDRR